MKVYIAGPMTGIKEFNFPAFDQAQEALECEGHTVVSPANISRAMGVDATGMNGFETLDSFGIELTSIIKKDLLALLECDAIYLLKGWMKSKGAFAEYNVALWAGIELKEQE